MYYLVLVLSVIASAIDCTERHVSGITYYIIYSVSNVTLNSDTEVLGGLRARPNETKSPIQKSSEVE